MSKIIRAVAGIVINSQQKILVAKRLDHVPLGGLWEFPGGKVEPGETLEQALAREILEEVGLIVLSSSLFMEVHHFYPDSEVFLYAMQVHEYTGEAQGLEGQQIAWINIQDLPKLDFPAGNLDIIDALLHPAAENV